MQHFGKAALRVTKNYTKGYSDTQAKVRDATSNDPWGPSGTQMNEIAQLTYNQNDFIEIMEMLDKRLNDKGKNWRHVFKSLTVLDYCLHQGSENVVIYFRDNIYIIKTLKEFQYMDEDGKDQGANVRQKAKDITNLLQDESRLREERRSRAHMRDRMIRGAGGEPVEYDPDEDENATRRDRNQANGLAGKRPNRDEDELKKAIEESKKTLAREMVNAEERELQAALKASEEEENKRKKDVDNSNSNSLFDDQNNVPSPSSNNLFPLVDATIQPVPQFSPYQQAEQMQPQFTSFNPYQQTEQVHPQFTAFNPYQQVEPVQPQFTAFNPYQQQAVQEAMKAEYLNQQQAYLQQQQAQIQQQQSLFPPAPQVTVQPTGFGSNNPFAPSTPSPSSFAPSPTPSNQPSFNLGGTYENHSPSNLSSSPTPSSVSNTNPYGSPSPSSSTPSNPYTQKPINVKTKKQLGENEAHLESLFANRDDGQDTFGNTGVLKYGYTDAGRAIVAQKTAGITQHNPFAQQHQQQNSEKPFFDI